MLEAGAQLGAYTIVRPLGAGGMGVVYLARHRHIGREAAIKVLLPEMTRNEEIVARFLTEARATAVVRHPGIVEILDCDIDATGRAFIVMEYLRGESLAECLLRNKGALSDQASVVSIGAQVAGALAAAHAAGIVHRDLKPDNLFLCSDGQPGAPLVVKIVDFGIAKLVSGDGGSDGRKTRIGSMLGTPAYMSPEQARDSSTIDHRADIYALGCILFELAAGRPPFVRPGAGEVMVAHIVETPPRLASLVAGVSPLLDELVAQMLEKDPGARPQTMTDVLERIESLGDGRAAPLAATILPRREDSQVGPLLAPGQAAPSLAGTRPRTPQPATSTPAPSRAAAPAPSLARGPAPILPGGTRVLPASQYTTMSESAAEVTGDDLPAVASTPGRRRPLIIGAASVAALAAVVLVVALALKGSPAPAPAPTPLSAAPPPAAPPPAAPPATAPPAADPTPTPPPTAAPPAPAIIEVASEPPGAEVFLPGDHAARGRTPFRVKIDPGAAPVHVVLKARGYSDADFNLKSDAQSPLSVKLEKLDRAGKADKAEKLDKTDKTDTTATAARDHKPHAKPSTVSGSKGSGYKMMGD
jgi:serine/threonine-protein kinase